MIRSCGRLLGAVCAVAWLAAACPAQTLDVKLNILYSNPMDNNSSGTWELVAKSSHSGISSLEVYLTGITSPMNVAPQGTVNGVHEAGFGVFPNPAAGPGGSTHMVVAQQGLTDGERGSGEQSIFYGVGTLMNGEPGDIGPAFTTLSGVTGSPWATGDSLGNAAWNTAAVLISGQFNAGSTPNFFNPGTGASRGVVFTALGTSMAVGSISGIITASTTVEDNFISSGDYNEDGFVDVLDYILFRDSLGATAMPAGSGADGDGNGTIGQGDYAIWAANYGSVPGAGSAAGLSAGVAVPEPGTGLLLLFGGVGLLAMSTIRRKPRGICGLLNSR